MDVVRTKAEQRTNAEKERLNTGGGPPIKRSREYHVIFWENRAIGTVEEGLQVARIPPESCLQVSRALR